ncbi:MAG TPA: energy transducer TonB [Bryobacteraceae bacterium]|nr:energy transducer TonB [Bryobacteraceae bacterium]
MKKITIVFSLLTAFAAGSAIAQEADLKVSNAEAMKAVTTKVQPDYPVIAKQLHLEGAVEVEAHINENGAVDSVKPITGNAVLANAAVAATKNWKFAPFTSNGKAVKAVTELTFTFKL